MTYVGRAYFLAKSVFKKKPLPTWYGICVSFMIAAAESKLLIEHLAKMLPTITASLAVASSARGSKNPRKKAFVLKIDFLTALYKWQLSFLYFSMFYLTFSKSTRE